MRGTVWTVLGAAVIVIGGSCAHRREAIREETLAPQPSTGTIVAKYTRKPIRLDGVLDDPAWKTAIGYPLAIAQSRREAGEVLQEPGTARVAWDDQYFYLSVEFVDTDIVAQGEEDQLKHFMLGDVCELFLKPEGSSWYWELFATPRGKKSTIWFAEKSMKDLEKAYAYRADLKVAAHCNGTLNASEDRDRGWSVELAMPVKNLTEKGDAFCAGAQWRILIARYNYSRYLSCSPKPEYSMVPALSRVNYHLLDEYAVLELVK